MLILSTIKIVNTFILLKLKIVLWAYYLKIPMTPPIFSNELHIVRNMGQVQPLKIRMQLL